MVVQKNCEYLRSVAFVNVDHALFTQIVCLRLLRSRLRLQIEITVWH